MSKEEWKKTEKELGSAFKGFGKAFVKTAKYTADKADEKVNGTAPEDSSAPAAETPKDESVFKDGTWRETGKGLAHALKGLGSTVLHTVDEAVSSDDKKEDK